MAELERELNCDNCGCVCRIIYDSDRVFYDPELCPFCGEMVGTEEETEEFGDFNDDGLEDEDDDLDRY